MRIAILINVLFSMVLVTTQAGAQKLPCCGDVDQSISIDFASASVGAVLNPLGNPLIQFEIDGVLFTRVVDDVAYSGSSLLTNGGQQSGGMFLDASVRLELVRPSCAMCLVAAEINPHGPMAGLTANNIGGRTVRDSASGNAGVALVARGAADAPFYSATISGQETEIFVIIIE